MISGADRRPEKIFTLKCSFRSFLAFFYCLKVRFLLNKRGMEVCIIVFFFDAKKKLNKSQKKTTAASRPIFAKKKLRNAKKKLGASRRFCQKITLFSFFWQNFAKKKLVNTLTGKHGHCCFLQGCSNAVQRSIGAGAAGGGGFEKHCVLKSWV